ncbi:pilus assembly PilX N-terminal domain-containing protein [Anaerorhabdus sp.]|uniref:pilus assembly PilX N-terminal domain-containing protein n=1 Tax=Anaerorhabdus sp. TaxID=1872524 RepID=UPI002FC82121
MKKESKKGVVLVYVILIFAILTILGAGLLTITNHNTKMTTMEISSEQAYQSALSGLETTLASFELDPTNGAMIANMVRSGQTPTSKLDVTSQKMGVVDIKISCKLEPPTTDIAACKKLQVDSTATIDGLSRSVVGYLNIIEGGFDKPIVINDSNGFGGLDAQGNGANSIYCLFDQPIDDCARLDKKLPSDQLQTVKFENEEEVFNTYKKFLEDKVKGITKQCKAGQTIDANCSMPAIWNNITVDNSKGDIYIDLTKIKSPSFDNVNLTLTDVDSENMVVIIVKDLSIEDSQIGQPGTEDNLLLISTSRDSIKSFDLEIDSDSGDTAVYGWVIHPFGEIDIETDEPRSVDVYGGLFAQEISTDKFVSIYGVQASSKMMGLLAEAGLTFSGGSGGVMTFAKTYD